MTTSADRQIQLSISWVKPELDLTIQDIKTCLEAYGHNLANFEPLLPVLEHLKLARGAFQILEFYGASILIEDMERTTRSLLARLSSKPEDAYEALVQAAIALEGYLDRLSQSPTDAPQALLPVINDLRAARNEALLTESSLFLPNLSIVPRIPDDVLMDEAKQASLAETAKSLRPYFHAALLTWFRNPKDVLSLQQIKLVIRNLESSAMTPRLRQLWWVAGGLVEALIDKGLRTNVSIRLILGQYDRYIKLVSNGEFEDVEKNPPTDMLKNILFYVAHAVSRGERVSTLKKAYNLDQITLDEADLKSLRENIRAPKTETFSAIARELNKNLANIKTIVDSYVRGQNRSMLSGAGQDVELESVIQPLRHIADTLGLMSLGKERRSLMENIESFEAKLKNDTLKRDDIMALAGCIVHVESVVNNIGNERRMKNSHPGKFNERRRQHKGVENAMDAVENEPINRLPGTEYRLFIQKAAQQARENLIQVKKDITAFLASKSRHELVQNIPHLLNEVHGCLVIIAHPFAARLTLALTEFANKQLLDSQNLADEQVLDRFAEAVVGLEYFLEGVSEGKSQLHTILAITRENLAAIGYPVQEPKQMEKRQPSLESVVTNIAHAKNRNNEAQKQPIYIPVDIEQADDEVAEIFAEEAAEEIEKLATQLETLKQDIADKDALNNIRHVFHTLKGSGRIAGASDISEFAAAIEEYINRVSTGAIDLESRGLTLLVDSYEVLLLLLSNLQHKAAPPVKANNIIQEAISLSDKINEAEPTPSHASEPLTQANMPLASDSPASSDQTSETQQPLIASAVTGDVLDLVDQLDKHIDYYRQTQDTDPNSKPVIQLIEKLQAVTTSDEQQNEFSETTALLLRYLNNLINTGNLLTIETLDILEEYSATTRDFLTRPLMDQVAEEMEANVSEQLTDEQSLAAPEAFEDEEDEIVMPVVRAANEQDSEAALDGSDDMSLIDIFVDEAQDLIRQANDILAQWLSNSPNEENIVSLQRVLHTLKGSARMAGITAIGNIAHSSETLLEKLSEDLSAITPELLGIMHDVFDSCDEIIAAVQSGHDFEPPFEIIEAVNVFLTPSNDEPVAVETSIETQAPVETVEPAESVTQEQEQDVEAEKTEIALPPAAQETRTPLETRANAKNSEPMRISADTIDTLVELSKAESRLIGDTDKQVAQLRGYLEEMDEAISRLQGQLRDVEFGHHSANEPSNAKPLDISSFSGDQQQAQRLTENVGDIENLHSMMTRLTIESGNLIQQLSKTHEELSESLINSRMTVFSDQTQRMNLIVRQACRETDKKAQLLLHGLEGAVDRALMDHLTGPFEHLLRNAIAHGIETPEQRAQKGKPEAGRIDFTFDRDDNHLVFTISDDGAGINVRRIFEKAVAKKLINEEDKLTDDELTQFIFEPGFSTHNDISQLAGRGIGMDVVNSEIQKLGGEILVHTEADQGSTFTIRVPFTSTLNKTLMCRSSNTLYAVSQNLIEATRPVDRTTLKKAYSQSKPSLEIGGEQYPLWYLGTLLNDHAPLLPQENKVASIILIRNNRVRIALHVDEILEIKDVMITPTGPQLGKINGISGASILNDGEVALILDIPALLRMAIMKTARPMANDSDAPALDSKPNIMVVDDSITVRKVTERFLRRNEYEPILAKDGIEALEILEHTRPSLFLLDIEMPRMDGLELARTIRKNPAHANTPIIMITSRTSKAHKQAADEAGVDIFLGKPYQENQLLSYIKRLLEGGLE